jgi:fructosamine-3-kinase
MAAGSCAGGGAVLSADVLEALLAAGIVADPRSPRLVEGGSINTCYRIAARDGRQLFLKLNEPDCADMFAAEAEGLRELRAADAVRVPEPVANGLAESAAWLALEWLGLEAGSPAAAARLGAALAAQHRHTAQRFGWRRDNTIGSTLQRNVQQDDWLVFLRNYRLGFQLRLAAGSGGSAELQDKGQRVLEALPRFFGSYRPVPALLHGDLWAGNWGMIGAAEPVIFDPAVYFGDRESDLAMTELFGGFPREFYGAYGAAWPLDAGYPVRRDVYNLYHVLNHLNLFGGSYQRQALSLMDRLLSRP